jgi:hypothetical protein
VISNKEHPVLKSKGNLRFIFPLEGGGRGVFFLSWKSPEKSAYSRLGCQKMIVKIIYFDMGGGVAVKYFKMSQA